MQNFELLSDIGGIEDISYLYLAKNISKDAFVSLKYTDLTLSTDFELIQELQRTIVNTKACKHENILPYYDCFLEEEQLWTVTIPSERGTCKNILKSENLGLGHNQVSFILKGVLKALVYLHENHMIHNDIRADNIVIDSKGQVKLTGLRQVRHLNKDGQYVDAIFSLIGDNLEWAAPEILAQNTDYDASADIYSIGITALELYYNKTPFDDWPPLKILQCKLEFPVPKIQSGKRMDKNMTDFVRICIKKDPETRPAAVDLLKHPFIKGCKLQKFI